MSLRQLPARPRAGQRDADDRQRIPGRAELGTLPFDGYLVAYKDRSPVLDTAYARQVNAGGGLLNPTIVSDGEVIGTWKRALKKGSITITASLFRPLTKFEQQQFNHAKSRYAAILGMPASPR